MAAADSQKAWTPVGPSDSQDAVNRLAAMETSYKELQEAGRAHAAWAENELRNAKRKNDALEERIVALTEAEQPPPSPQKEQPVHQAKDTQGGRAPEIEEVSVPLGRERMDEILSSTALIVIQALFAILTAALGFTCSTHITAMEYGYFRDVNIMIFFGFGFLMTFLYRHGLSAIGYCLVISALVVEMSLIAEYFLNSENGKKGLFDAKYTVTIEHLLNGLFCAGAVMISYGAVIGKVSPFQLIIMSLFEVIAFWGNFRLAITETEAHDVGGGMVIHMFGAYFGLAATWWLTKFQPKAIEHDHEKSNYSSDIFSLAGTIFLWCLWPSFQSAVAGAQQRQMLATTNTFISLCSSCIAFAGVSRILNKGKYDVVHLQNATLAGGVVMGVAGDMDMGLHGPAIAGFLAGALSCFGYAIVNPLLLKLNIHDTCGVNNLHGMPGILGAIVGIIVTAMYKNGEETGTYNTKGFAGIGADAQTYALLITLGMGLGCGFITGFVMTVPLAKLGVVVPPTEYYHDRHYFAVSDP